MKSLWFCSSVFLVRFCTLPAIAQPFVPVTVDNFIRAESDLYLGNGLKEAGGTGKFFHHRELMPIDRQSVIRANRDTLYSSAVIDLDAGPVTVTLPDAGKRFRSMHRPPLRPRAEILNGAWKFPEAQPLN